VVSEGSVRATRTDGSTMTMEFCDIFEMRHAKIAKVTTYLMMVK
jgi:ketosteroid isomerase-like protein